MKLLLSAMLFVLVSCNGGDSGGPDKKVTPMFPEAEWTINSTPANFPKNYQIKLNDKISVDSCQTPDLFKTSISNSRKLIHFGFNFIPEVNDHLKVEIVDRGEFCDNNAIFHSEDSVTFGVVVLTVEGKETHSIGVTLSN